MIQHVPQNVVDLNTQEEYMYRIRVYRYPGTGIKDIHTCTAVYIKYNKIGYSTGTRTPVILRSKKKTFVFCVQFLKFK